MRKKLGIIIPTRNRQYYCYRAAQQVLQYCGSDCEVVLYDNSDLPTLKGEIEGLCDERITYVYDGSELSFVDTFSKAISISRADYLCMLGDDDGILPTIKPAIDAMTEFGLDAFVPALSAVYFWPSDQPIAAGARNGYLHLSSSNYKVKHYNLNKGLQGLVKAAGQGYQSLELPRLYHGIVRRSCVEEVRRRTGHYFGGLTPDIYMSVALANTCKRVVGISAPITISGISPKSGSAQSATGEHTGKLSDAPHLRGHQEYNWAEQVPEFYSVPTIWADSAIHALKDFDRRDLIEGFNKARLAAITQFEYPEYAAVVSNYVHETGLDNQSINIEKAKYVADKYWGGFQRRILKRPWVRKAFNLQDVAAADAIVRQRLDLAQFRKALTDML